MKEMCTSIPYGACPSCGHKQFIVDEISSNTYLLDRDGAILDFSENNYSAKGICCNCHKVYEMLPTQIGFIPLTPLRKILFEATPHAIATQVVPFYESKTPNPMEVSEE